MKLRISWRAVRAAEVAFGRRAEFELNNPDSSGDAHASDATERTARSTEER